jgi:hypothetical protein
LAKTASCSTIPAWLDAVPVGLEEIQTYLTVAKVNGIDWNQPNSCHWREM